MTQPLTIVMYHYVRDLERSRFPAIKGLATGRFRRQLDYITSTYTPVSIDDVLAVTSSTRKELPPNPILLTFDDGYIDHFTNVFPLLDAVGIEGVFFPPVQAVLEHKVLDVNKIQFVLASVPNAGTLLEEVLRSLDEFRTDHNLKDNETYLASVTEKHRYDTHDVTVLKRLLQRELPAAVRTEIVRRLFAKYVTSDEAAFACELYMSVDQIECLQRQGMRVGSHGYSHAWLNHISPASQAMEVNRSLAFLEQIGVKKSEWTICYPYGGFDDSLLEILRSHHCTLGFTVEPRVAHLGVDDALTLPRIDTNDLPS
jgi:peptidoglycan/xylan/chitin deacetylase (PgdA/CDA1 family)